MDVRQRDSRHRIIPESWLTLSICLIVDSSGSMGSYKPNIVEVAINAFFNAIGSSNDADELIRLCTYDSHEELDVLGGFSKASLLHLGDLRYGGGWNLPRAITVALQDSLKRHASFARDGFTQETPWIIVLSDNPVPFESHEQELQALAQTAEDLGAERLLRCLWVRSRRIPELESQFPFLKPIIANPSELQSCFRSLAEEAIRSVGPRARRNRIPNRKSHEFRGGKEHERAEIE